MVRHFATVIVNSGQDSGGADLNLSIGGVLAVLAVPGAFVSLSLFDKYSSLLQWMRNAKAFDAYRASLSDKYFFIVLSMVITGVVTTIKWDRILPNRQDYANLAVLPLRSRTIFLANLSAIVLLAAIFAIDVNAASAFLFPFVVMAASGTFPEFLSFVAVHAVSVILASFFTFFACFAIIGALMSLLPGAMFRKVSLVLRLTIIVALMTLLFTSFAVPPFIQKLPRNPTSFVRFLPSVWFVAFYQWLQGRAGPELAALARVAWQSSAGAAVLAVVFGAISYRRHYLRIPESSDSRQTSRRTPLRLASTLLDRTLLRSPFQRACYHFGLRALLRSETHCILFGAFLGLGFITASQSITTLLIDPAKPPLAAALCLAYFMILGLRFAFEVPALLPANWVYRLIIDQSRHEASPVARKLILTFVLPGVILPTLVLYSAIWGPWVGITHTILVLAMSVLLIEIVLLRFRKIPFACGLPDFQNHSIVVMLIYLIGFFAFTSFTAAIERWMFLQPLRFCAMPVVFALAWYGLHTLRRDLSDMDNGLVYDGAAAVEVQTLNLRTTVSID